MKAYPEDMDIVALKKIVEMMQYILTYKDISYNELSDLDQYEKQLAIERAFEIIGEATKRLSESFILKHSQIPWHKMARLRDRISHHYDDLDIHYLLKFINTNLKYDLEAMELLLKELL